MALQSSGNKISLLDVVTFTRASASVVKPFLLPRPAGTQRSLQFYYNQAFVTPSTFDATVEPNSDYYNISTKISTNTNGSTIFDSIGKIFSVRINNQPGYGTDENGNSYASGKEHRYVISNIPAGAYNIGAFYPVSGGSTQNNVIYYLYANNILITVDSNSAGVNQTSNKDRLSTISLNSGSNIIDIRHYCSTSMFPGLPNFTMYANILRVPS